MDEMDDLTAEIVLGLDLVPVPKAGSAPRRPRPRRAGADLAMVTAVVLVGLLTVTVALAVRPVTPPIRELVPAGAGGLPARSDRVLTPEGMTREVSSWVWVPDAARSWSRDVFGGRLPVGDELILARGAEPGKVNPSVGISLDSRIPEPDCRVGTPAGAREVATWIRSRPWLSATTPTRVTLEGIDALVIDITAAPGEEPPQYCPPGRVFILVHESQGDRHAWFVEPGETIRLLLFERFTGSAAPRTIGVTIQSQTGSFDAFVPEAMPVVRALLSTLAAYPD